MCKVSSHYLILNIALLIITKKRGNYFKQWINVEQLCL